MAKVRLLVSLLSLVLLIPNASRAQCQEETPYAWVGLTNSGSLSICEIQGAPGVVQVNVVAEANPTGKLRLALPDPPVGIVLGETWFFPFTGDRINGMELDLGCTAGGAVGTLTVFFPAPAACELWTVNNLEVEDCDGDVHPSVALPSRIGGNCLACFQNCLGLPPFNLFPLDGATAVPTNTEFTWQGGWTGPYTSCSIRIFTDPDCSTVQVVDVPCSDDHSIVLDFLKPETTYYWQAWWLDQGGGCSSGHYGVSALHSFTTEGPIAAQPATWGRVKSMYRD